MPLPSKRQLESRQKKAEEELKKLEEDYQNFLAKWNQLSKEESKLANKLKKNLDAAKIHKILKKITNLKD